MEHSQSADLGYREPDVPPATPPVIAPSVDPHEAAETVRAGGDSHAPGSQPAHFNQGDGGGDRDYPGQQPDEIVPDQGDTDVPQRTPDEVAPGQGDFDRPDSSPIEMPPQPDVAPETPPPPD